jgi:hypothetical protein
MHHTENMQQIDGRHLTGSTQAAYMQLTKNVQQTGGKQQTINRQDIQQTSS